MLSSIPIQRQKLLQKPKFFGRVYTGLTRTKTSRSGITVFLLEEHRRVTCILIYVAVNFYLQLILIFN